MVFHPGESERTQDENTGKYTKTLKFCSEMVFIVMVLISLLFFSVVLCIVLKTVHTTSLYVIQLKVFVTVISELF